MRERKTVLPPGSTIGILGGGQLARMMCVASARLGLNTHIYAPEADCPAAALATQLSCGDYDDAEAVINFAKQCGAVTYEFENVPVMTAKACTTVTSLRPNARALDISQDRLNEKSFLRAQLGIEVAGFEDVTNVFSLKRALKRLGLPAVLKTRRFGYDGKGQIIIKKMEEAEAAFNTLSSDELILEAFIPFKREVSIIAARGLNGEIAAYPLTENMHRNHILHTSTAPAENDSGHAQTIAAKILEQLDYVGVMGVEFFELEDGKLLVNEIAPRVHNSGHWTQDGGCVDQFEQHIRAVAGWPLGDTTPKYKVVMTNLIGAEIDDWHELVTRTDTRLHLYGKTQIRAGRKMGHINQIVSG